MGTHLMLTLRALADSCPAWQRTPGAQCAATGNTAATANCQLTPDTLRTIFPISPPDSISACAFAAPPAETSAR